MKNVIKSLAKSVFVPLVLTTGASAADAGIHKKILGSGRSSSSASHNNTTTLIISNNAMKDIIKIVKTLENSGLLFTGVSEQSKMKLDNKKEDFLVCY